jgi:hypothetical protein
MKLMVGLANTPPLQKVHNRAIQAELQRDPIIIEHWHYRAGRAPSRHIFEDWEEFGSYLVAEAFTGDAIDVWSFATLCRPDHRIAEGKCPAEDGTVPKGGAY